MRHPDLEHAFPNLQLLPYEVTSPVNVRYNCIAWAAGDTTRLWWPIDGYWPKGVDRGTSIDTFIAAFNAIGYSTCDNGSLELALEKIVIYSIGGEAKHAARQLADGQWTSKCGKNVDISHALEGLSGIHYGYPTVFMSRQRPHFTDRPK